MHAGQKQHDMRAVWGSRSCDKCTEFWAWPAVAVHGAAAAVAQSAAMAVSGEAAAIDHDGDV